MTKTFKIVNGDVVRSRATGRLAFVTGKAKAEQTMKRMLALNSPEGAGLEQVIADTSMDEFVISSRAQRLVRRAFDELVRLQRSRQLTERTAEERLATIARMYVTHARFGNAPSQTGYVLRVDALTIAGLGVSAESALVP